MALAAPKLFLQELNVFIWRTNAMKTPHCLIGARNKDRWMNVGWHRRGRQLVHQVLSPAVAGYWSHVNFSVSHVAGFSFISFPWDSGWSISPSSWLGTCLWIPFLVDSRPSLNHFFLCQNCLLTWIASLPLCCLSLLQPPAITQKLHSFRIGYKSLLNVWARLLSHYSSSTCSPPPYFSSAC